MAHLTGCGVRRGSFPRASELRSLRPCSGTSLSGRSVVERLGREALRMAHLFSGSHGVLVRSSRPCPTGSSPLPEGHSERRPGAPRPGSLLREPGEGIGAFRCSPAPFLLPPARQLLASAHVSPGLAVLLHASRHRPRMCTPSGMHLCRNLSAAGCSRRHLITLEVRPGCSSRARPRLARLLPQRSPYSPPVPISSVDPRRAAAASVRPGQRLFSPRLGIPCFPSWSLRRTGSRDADTCSALSFSLVRALARNRIGHHRADCAPAGWPRR